MEHVMRSLHFFFELQLFQAVGLQLDVLIRVLTGVLHRPDSSHRLASRCSL